MLSVGRNRKRQRNLIFPHFHVHAHSGTTTPQRNAATCESGPAEPSSATASPDQLSNFSQSLTLSEPQNSSTSENQQFQTNSKLSSHATDNAQNDEDEEKCHEPNDSLPSPQEVLSSASSVPSSNASGSCSLNSGSSSTSGSCFFKVTKIQPLHLFLPKLSLPHTTFPVLHAFTHHSHSSSSSSNISSQTVKNSSNTSREKNVSKSVRFSSDTKTWDGPRESLVSFDELLFCFLVKGKAIGDGDVLKWTKRSVSKINSLTLLLLHLLHRLSLLNSSSNLNLMVEAESEEQEKAECEESVACLPQGGGHALRVEKSYKPYLVTLLSVLITALKHAIKLNNTKCTSKQTQTVENRETVTEREVNTGLNVSAQELGLEETEVVEYSKEVERCLKDVSQVNNLTFKNDFFNISTSVAAS